MKSLRKKLFSEEDSIKQSFIQEKFLEKRFVFLQQESLSGIIIQVVMLLRLKRILILQDDYRNVEK